MDKELIVKILKAIKDKNIKELKTGNKMTVGEAILHGKDHPMYNVAYQLVMTIYDRIKEKEQETGISSNRRDTNMTPQRHSPSTTPKYSTFSPTPSGAMGGFVTGQGGRA